MDREDHAQCRLEVLRDWQAMCDRIQENTGVKLAGQVMITTFRVVVPGFKESWAQCIHGVTFWIAPDAEMAISLRNTLPGDWSKP